MILLRVWVGIWDVLNFWGGGLWMSEWTLWRDLLRYCRTELLADNMNRNQT